MSERGMSEDSKNPLKRPAPQQQGYRRSKNPIVALTYTHVGEEAPIGRVVLEIFADVAPLTAESMRALCLGAGKGNTGCRLCYEGTRVDEVTSRLIRMGDVTYGSSEGDTIYGEYYEERPAHTFSHVDAGILTLPRCTERRYADPEEAAKAALTLFCFSSQFTVTLAPAVELDATHMVVGRVLEGLDTLQAIGKLPCGTDRRPVTPVYVSECKELSSLGRATTEQTEMEKKLRKSDADRREGLEAKHAAGEGETRVVERIKRVAKTRVAKRNNIVGVGGEAVDAQSDEEKARPKKARRRFF
eukprot:TRINITY_DN17036_c0_g1_i1.p1 TRINITY_DN17036_c0_g1~~TRINITY_DN17036_c0_g1_i1.p1  ORF type:complete len:301 (+),score=86.56 TRINITY_DN17036_c0_g1_i1:129-1031(+)